MSDRQVVRIAAGLALAVLACATLASAAPPPARTFTVLQLNLCNSGQADCYAGGAAIPEAAGVIAATRPDAVTLNEICRRDLAALAPALPGPAYTAFQSVYDIDGTPYHCVDGDDFGIGVIARTPAGATPSVRGGRHPIQRDRPDELRSWECVTLPGRQVCATHLVDGHPDVALAECRWLLGRVAVPAVVAGDLNLTARGGIAGCVPAGWSRQGDGGVQWVLASGDAVPAATRRIRLRDTDHPGLLVTLRLS